MPDHKLRLLFLTYQGDLAGSTHSIAYLCKGLVEKGHRVCIGIRKESLLWELLEGTEVKRISMRFGGKLDLNNWRQIRDAVKRYDIQIINAQSSHDRYTSIFANWRYRLKARVIHTRRQMPLSMGGPLQNWLYTRGTAGIVAVSEPVKQRLVRLGIRGDHVRVIHNGTPREKYAHTDHRYIRQLKEKFGITDRDFVIGSVSRRKNQEQILQALKLLEEPVKLIFCGIGKEEGFTRHLTGIEGRHQVFFEGNVPADRILNYYKLFHIKILASTMEGLSQSLLEAMAMGVPVAATAHGGNLDLIDDGVNGLLFNDGDLKKIAGILRKLRSDPAVGQRLIKNGLKTALETYSIENTIRNYEAYFYDIVSDK